ncbi:putative Type IV pilus assembly PilZ [Vibrio nigripulchritudo MADA3029]|uniref:Cyclic diguanosine monophosphate-binding protein n=1 Tax=Vibrio nigripulchritudo SOn1 TaxID=1238450 RepID=A0AAV2VJ79_9VIBR|nr:PilZ domain-containing protein [Vibrio nigripulchritudo]CCN47994.1 putative Type IV pilus assembly PilZ [Vibrio nigripulchritudo MADA3020]CCN53134.1 putative Type IV pilus assembly PilZ [Vibrio nigripulchritudo MADA3021]CCN57902.1 putative Type IV pilus assembly PilZ [Vibrio nigripulchritudo MADA3029]CCO44440.1 putative Type IV pilus assembly PilZ [Vibrio nigripulchritudo SOn1]BCL71032.1 pilus protein PilZ [Vibrio nigripulchritudo]
MIERRRFSRVVYQAPARLIQGDLSLSSEIRDLSLHGLLLSSTPDTHQLSQNTMLDVDIELPESDIVISLEAEIVELNDQFMRVSIHHIDIDSISHLKRLVELNVGDEALLHRELEQLSDLGA